MKNRTRRIGTLIKERISEILREKVADPRIGFVSVTDVEVAPDLKSAKVFVSIYGTDRDKKKTMSGLLSARGYIQGVVGSSLDLRYTPVLNFILDKSIEQGSRLLVIMSKLEKEAAESKRLHHKEKKSSRRK